MSELLLTNTTDSWKKYFIHTSTIKCRGWDVFKEIQVEGRAVCKKKEEEKGKRTSRFK